MRHINQAGIELVKRFETFVDHVYLCPARVKTIYWGHVVKPGEVYDGSKEQGEEYLRLDLRSAECAVLRNVRVPLSDDQFAALVSFTFNVGGGALQRSTLRQTLNRGDYDEVPEEIEKWVYAGGKKLKGLVLRREQEGLLFSGGREMGEGDGIIDIEDDT